MLNNRKNQQKEDMLQILVSISCSLKYPDISKLHDGLILTDSSLHT